MGCVKGCFVGCGGLWVVGCGEGCGEGCVMSSMFH